MASLNQCNFIGNLGRDPETRHTAGGMTVANFSLAVTEKYKGEEKTEWVNVSLFGKLAEVAGEYLTKGKAVYISGRMQTRKWQDKDGNDRYTTEIIGDKLVMLGGGGKGDGARKEAPVGSVADDDDQIPF